MFLGKSVLTTGDIDGLISIAFDTQKSGAIATSLSRQIRQQSSGYSRSVSAMLCLLQTDIIASIEGQLEQVLVSDDFLTLMRACVVAVADKVFRNDDKTLDSVLKREINFATGLIRETADVPTDGEQDAEQNDNADGNVLLELTNSILERVEKQSESMALVMQQLSDISGSITDTTATYETGAASLREVIVTSAKETNDKVASVEMTVIDKEAETAKSLAGVGELVTNLGETIDGKNQELARRAYSDMSNTISLAKAEFKDLVSSISSQTMRMAEQGANYQGLVMSTNNAANRLSEAADIFKECVFTAERYASTITDVLAIQQLQARVNDLCQTVINDIHELSVSWEQDRRNLYDSVNYVKNFMKGHTVYNDVLRGIDTLSIASNTILNWIEKHDKGNSF